MARQRKVNYYDVADEPDTSLMTRFLARDPEDHELYGVIQTIVQEGREDLFDLLLAHDADLTKPFDIGVRCAALCDQDVMFERLLTQELVPIEHLRLKVSDRNPLLNACMNGNLKMSERLLDLGAPIDNLTSASTMISNGHNAACQEDGFSPLLNAIRAGSVALVEALVARGAGINEPTSNHRTPLEVAQDIGNGAVIEALLRAGAKVRDFGDLNWDQAMDRGAIERIEQLLDEGEVSEDQFNRGGIYAANRSQYHVIKMLFARGLPPEWAYEALCSVASSGRFDVVDELLELGIGLDPPTKGEKRQTPLMSASLYDNWDVVLDYLKRGADPNQARGLSGEIPITCAARANRPDVVKALLDLGSDTDDKTIYGDTALGDARRLGHRKVVKLLEDAGATTKTPSQIKNDLKRRLKALARPCWSPKIKRSSRHPFDGDAFGGHPALLEDEDWPVCGGCKQDLSLALQFDLAGLPAGHPHHGLSGFVQLFFCPDCDDWYPRRLPEDAELAEGEPLHDTAQIFDRAPMVGWYKKKTDLPYREPKNKAFDLATKGLEPEDESMLFSMNLSGDKLGGWPNWVQHNEWPKCTECKKAMDMLLQVDSRQNLDWTFGDNGVGWIFMCKRHPEVIDFGWQCA